MKTSKRHGNLGPIDRVQFLTGEIRRRARKKPRQSQWEKGSGLLTVFCGQSSEDVVQKGIKHKLKIK